MAARDMAARAVMGSRYPKSKVAELLSEVHLKLRMKVPVAPKPQIVVLSHFAMKVWDRSHYGAWHLFGHSHGTLPDNPPERSCDVGVDANGFAPLNLDDVAGVMARKHITPRDHHRSI